MEHYSSFGGMEWGRGWSLIAKVGLKLCIEVYLEDKGFMSFQAEEQYIQK